MGSLSVRARKPGRADPFRVPAQSARCSCRGRGGCGACGTRPFHESAGSGTPPAASPAPWFDFARLPVHATRPASPGVVFGRLAGASRARPVGAAGAIEEVDEATSPGVAADEETTAAVTPAFTPAPAPGVTPPSPPPPAPAPPTPAPPAPAPAASICDTQLPSGEKTKFNGWGSGTRASIGRWTQTLTPTSTNFSGCSVTEADPGGGTDTCWFSGSAFAPFTGVTGGTWTVGSGNVWGDDWVGWFSNAVTYYRKQGRAPCGCSFPQSMRMVRPGGNVEYVRHTLSANIGTTTVSSTRAGQTRSKTWP